MSDASVSVKVIFVDTDTEKELVSITFPERNVQDGDQLVARVFAKTHKGQIVVVPRFT